MANTVNTTYSPGMARRRTWHPNRTAKRERSQVRQEFRATLSDQEQLDRLVARGHGHCQEAERLRERLNYKRELKAELRKAG